jgi:hypothetical protein
MRPADRGQGFTIDSLVGAKDREAVLAVVEKCLPDIKTKTQLNFAAQLNQFCNQMQVDDLVVVPLKATGQIAVGEVAGPLGLRPGRDDRARLPREREHDVERARLSLGRDRGGARAPGRARRAPRLQSRAVLERAHHSDAGVGGFARRLPQTSYPATRGALRFVVRICQRSAARAGARRRIADDNRRRLCDD